MSRPNKRTDLRLLQAGKKILLEQGVNCLTVSAICKTAKVNQGMFVYNFKNKAAFMSKLLNGLLLDVLKDLVLPDVEKKKPIERMEYGLVFCCMAAVKYPRLFLQFSNDTLTGGDETLMRLFLRRCQRELRRVFRFFKPAQDDGDITKNITLAEFLALVWPPLIYSSASLGNIMDAVPLQYKEDPQQYLTEDAIRRRVHRLLATFRPEVYDNL